MAPPDLLHNFRSPAIAFYLSRDTGYSCHNLTTKSSVGDRVVSDHDPTNVYLDFGKGQKAEMMIAR